MILNSMDEFLVKFDMIQREMGKSEHEFIPAKFTNDSGVENTAILMNVFIGAVFLTLFWQMYRGGNKMSTGKKMGQAANKDKDKKGGFFGGGGFNDMMGVGKSNAK